MQERKGFKIILNANVPFIKQYDKEHGTAFGTFFDEFERIGCPCMLGTPSENEVIFGSKEPFFVTSDKAHLTKSIGSFESICIRGESIVCAAEKFVNAIFGKCAHGYFISEGADSEKLYRLVVKEKTMKLELHQKEGIAT